MSRKRARFPMVGRNPSGTWRRKPYKQVVNDAIGRGLAPGPARRPSKRYRVTPHEARLLPGHDRVAFNRLADELEDAAVLAKGAGGKR